MVGGGGTMANTDTDVVSKMVLVLLTTLSNLFVNWKTEILKIPWKIKVWNELCYVVGGGGITRANIDNVVVSKMEM